MSRDCADYIIERFEENGRTRMQFEKVYKEGLIDGMIPAGTTDLSIKNSLRSKGYDLNNGLIVKLSDDRSNPVPFGSQFKPYRDAIRSLMDDAEAPMSVATILKEATTVLTVSGESLDPAPIGFIGEFMRRLGYYHIEGVGWWKFPQFTTAEGGSIIGRTRSVRRELIIEAFNKRGWPLTTDDFEELFPDQLNKDVIPRYAARNDAVMRSIGYGLYVPVDKLNNDPFPMSEGVRSFLLTLDGSVELYEKYDRRLFRAARHGIRLQWLKGEVKRVQISGSRQQRTVPMLTPLGKKELEKRKPKIKKDLDLF